MNKEFENNLDIESLDEGANRILQLRGNHTVYNSNQLKSRVDKAIQDGMARIIVDLRHCAYIDSAGLGAFVSSRFHSDKNEVGFVLCNVPAPVNRILRLAKIDKILKIYPTLEDALRAE